MTTAREKVIDAALRQYGPVLEALADWSRSDCPCPECWLKREIRRIEAAL